MNTPTPPTSGHATTAHDWWDKYPIRAMLQDKPEALAAVLELYHSHRTLESRPPQPVPTATPGGMTGEQT